MRGGGDDTTEMEMEMEDILIDFYNFISRFFPEAKEFANKDKVKGIIKFFKEKAKKAKKGKKGNTNNWKDILYDSLLKKYELNPDILDEIFLKAKVDVQLENPPEKPNLSGMCNGTRWLQEEDVILKKIENQIRGSKKPDSEQIQSKERLEEKEKKLNQLWTRRAEAAKGDLETDIQALNERMNEARALISRRCPPSVQPPPTAPSVQMSSEEGLSLEERWRRLAILHSCDHPYFWCPQVDTLKDKKSDLSKIAGKGRVEGINVGEGRSESDGSDESDEAGKGRSESDESDEEDGSDGSDESGKGRSEGDEDETCEAVGKTEPSNQSNQPSINWSTLIGQSGNKKNIREFYDRKEHSTDRTSLEQWVLDGGPFIFDEGKEKAALKKGRGGHSCCGSVGRRNRNPRRSKGNSE